jgi:peroxiredoxin Q/BCP
VAFFGASTDKPETNQEFARKLDLNYPLLSDPGAKVAREYGVAGMLPIAARWTFIIGADGKILSVEKDVKPETAGDDLVRRLEELGIPKRK